MIRRNPLPKPIRAGAAAVPFSAWHTKSATPESPGVSRTQTRRRIAPTIGITNLISAGSAMSASSIIMRPVRIEIRPEPSSLNRSIPASWNAAA